MKISGISIAASRVKAKATYVFLVCKNCRKTREVPCRPGLGGAIVPRSCDHVPQVLASSLLFGGGFNFAVFDKRPIGRCFSLEKNLVLLIRGWWFLIGASMLISRR